MTDRDSSNELRISLPTDFEKRVRHSVGHFWQVKDGQAKNQGSQGDKDRGERAAVTGGKQLDGFVELFRDVLTQNAIPEDSIQMNTKLELPGYFRPSKKWDLIVVQNGIVYAAIECKSINSGSVGNNYNNRTEEAIGSAKDLLTAFREGAFGKSRRPWLGYLILVEDDKATTTPVRIFEPHFEVFDVFKKASYAQRLEEMCRRVMAEGLYDSATFLMSRASDYTGETMTIPADDLAVKPFALSLAASVSINMSI
jgi:hypothetical protein